MIPGETVRIQAMCRPEGKSTWTGSRLKPSLRPCSTLSEEGAQPALPYGSAVGTETRSMASPEIVLFSIPLPPPEGEDNKDGKMADSR
jgi:hypothetical protein